jgi:protein NrfD
MNFHPNVFGLLLLQTTAGGTFLMTFLYRFPSINRSFYRLHGLIFLLFSGGGLFALGPSKMNIFPLKFGHLDQFSVFLMLAGTAGMVIYNSLINFVSWTKARAVSRPILVISSLLLLGATGTATLILNTSLSLTFAGSVLLISMFVSSFLLGAVLLAMNWGHFYLTNPTLPIEPLAFLTRGLLGFMLATAVISGVMTYVNWQGNAGFSEGLLLESFQGLYLWGRLLIGVIGGLVISILAFRTVKMHSTQAATGLLYVALLMILFGEAFSRFLFLNLGILV